jgi:hypothetical protein
MVSFTLRPLYPCWEDHPPTPIRQGLGGLQSRSGRSGEEKKYHNCPCLGSNPGQARNLVSILTELQAEKHIIMLNKYKQLEIHQQRRESEKPESIKIISRKVIASHTVTPVIIRGYNCQSDSLHNARPGFYFPVAKMF